MTLNQETVGLYAETFVRQVRAGGILLDYSASSLEQVDHLVRDTEAAFALLEEQQRRITIFYLGCYVGEVLVRALSAQWVFSSNWFDAQIQVLGEEGGVELRPFEKSLSRFLEGEEGNTFVGYFSGLQDLLAQLKRPEVANPPEFG